MPYHDICLFPQISESVLQNRELITLSTKIVPCPFCMLATTAKVWRFRIFCVTCFWPFYLSQRRNQIINLLLFSQQLFIINLLLVWWHACKIMVFFCYKECYIFFDKQCCANFYCVSNFLSQVMKGNFLGNFYFLGFFKSRLLFVTRFARNS